MISIVAVPSPVAGQGTPDLRQGTVVRVTAPERFDRPLEATFLDVTGSHLRVRPRSGAEAVEILFAEVSRLEWSPGERSRWKGGAVIGAFALGIPAALYCARECEGDPTAPGLYGFVGGAVPGALLGAAIGLLFRTRDWLPVPDTALRPGGR